MQIGRWPRAPCPKSQSQAWSEFCEGGWLMLDASPEIGGMGLPTALGNAVQEMMDRHCLAFA
jgi:alkylation response protein AidB-like acyl-CoA dehydrogenase